MDVKLPPTASKLGIYNGFSWDLSSFAVYSLVKTSKESIDTIASQLTGKWWEEPGIGLNGGHPLVRAAPDYQFEGRSLRDVIQAHISLVEKDAQQTSSYDDYTEGYLAWFPIAFIVITSYDIKKLDVLFVYVDPYAELAGCPLDKFYFKTEDADSMLSSLRLGHRTCADAKKTCAIRP